MKNLKNYFKLLRIKDWRAYFLIDLLGFVLAKGYLFPIEDIFLFWLISFLFLGFGFSINDCFDVKEDRYHLEKRNLLVSKELSFREGLIFSLLLATLGLIFSLQFGLKIFLFALFSLILAFFYSAPPLRLKGRPFFDLISHGLFAGSLIFFFPLLFFKANLNLFHYLTAFSIFYLSIILELRNHLEDYEMDRKANLKTTVCFLGYQKSKKILKYLTIFSPLSFLPIFLLFFQNFYFLPFLIFTLSFLFLFLLSEDQKLGKNYRIFDLYSFSCLLLIAMAKIW